ncbi:MAG: hypothetical protein GX797_01780 [Chloroflexi bacterium]|nr:hypothetical protein [Chloroflexota bacterium]
MEKAARSPKSSLILASLIAAMILLLALNVVQSYAGLEGFSFWGYPYVRSFFEDPDNPIKMKKISCPPFIGLDESKLVSVSLTNTADRNVNAFFQAVVSSPDSEYGAVHIIREVPLQRGETRIETVEINSSNIVDNKYILLRSFMSWQPVYVSSRSIACQSVVIPFRNINSNLVGYGIYVLLTSATILLAILYRKHDPLVIRTGRSRSSLVYIVVVLLLMTIGNLTGTWILSFSMIVMIVLGFLAFWQVDFR